MHIKTYINSHRTATRFPVEYFLGYNFRINWFDVYDARVVYRDRHMHRKNMILFSKGVTDVCVSVA